MDFPEHDTLTTRELYLLRTELMRKLRIIYLELFLVDHPPSTRRLAHKLADVCNRIDENKW